MRVDALLASCLRRVSSAIEPPNVFEYYKIAVPLSALWIHPQLRRTLPQEQVMDTFTPHPAKLDN